MHICVFVSSYLSQSWEFVAISSVLNSAGKMASLVADYSSDSEDESSQENFVPDIQVKEEILEETPSEPSAPSNFFTTSDDVSDDDEEDSKTCKVEVIAAKEIKQEKPSESSVSTKLPSLSEINPGACSSSVFANPFEKAEQAKHKILEKHVRLTEAAPQKPAHQPVCWKFKKGKCHLGKNCRFFHAVDNLCVDEASGVGTGLSHSSSSTDSHSNIAKRSPYHPAAFADARRRPLEQEPIDEDSYLANAKKKRRVGINDRLLPPKKAFDALMEMRKKERPWTLPGASS